MNTEPELDDSCEDCGHVACTCDNRDRLDEYYDDLNACVWSVS